MNDLKKRVEAYADWDYNIKIAGPSFTQVTLDDLYPLDWEHINILLLREPENEYDSNAIKVLGNGKVMGYIPKMVAEHLAPQLDSGITFDVRLIYITAGEGRKIKTSKVALRRKSND